MTNQKKDIKQILSSAFFAGRDIQLCDPETGTKYTIAHASIPDIIDALDVAENEPCQCCEESEHQWSLISSYGDEKPYLVCSNCLISLVTYRLSKKQYKNLLKNGHEESEFLIHDDFYDEDGTATQQLKF
jgi:hypothetical protein